MSKKNDITFGIKHLGAISEATLNLNNLTTIIGPNSSSKTYLNYMIYGFLNYILNDNKFLILSDLYSIDDESGVKTIKGLFGNDEAYDVLLAYEKIILNGINDKKSILNINIKDVSEKLTNVFILLSRVFCFFAKRQIGLNVGNSPLLTFKPDDLDSIFELEFSGEIHDIKFLKPKDSYQMDLICKQSVFKSMPETIRDIIVPELVTKIFQSYFKQIFPNPVVITSERTGISFFYDKLKGLINTSQSAETIDDKLMYKVIKSKNNEHVDYGLYQQAVLDNITLFTSLINHNEDSFLVKNNENSIVEYIQKEINHGSYIIEGGDAALSEKKLLFKMKNDSSIEINAASSSIKSLSLLDLYIRKKAKPGDLLIIDEPELNLHPSNQRKIARLLVMLANKGIKVMFTTHSDYLMGEINTLIQAKALKEDSQNEIIEEFGLDQNMLLDKKDISAYFLNKKDSGQFDLKEVPEKNGALVLDSFDNEIKKFAEFSRTVKELAYEESF